jgi:hypothetical protein
MTWTETILSFVSPELLSLVFLSVVVGCVYKILTSPSRLP